MRYNFEWDPVKASENLRKHGISFESSADLMLDPLAVSLFDEEHSEGEERWVTIGRDSRGRVLVLVHTFSEASSDEWTVRIISARKATRREARDCEGFER